MANLKDLIEDGVMKYDGFEGMVYGNLTVVGWNGKFGIANMSSERIRRQNQLSIYDIINYGIWTYPTVKACRDAERYCLNNLTTKVITKEEMPDGYTETTFPSNIDLVISIFEEHGGVRNI